MRNYKIYIPLLILTFSMSMQACKKYAPINSGGGLDDWTAESHGAGATPNYDLVFNQNEVQRLDIVIESDYWDAMQSDLDAIMASQGGGGGGGGNFSDENPLYVPCQMYYNDKQWYDVGIRYKGNSSLSSSYSQGNGKLPLRIEMDHFSNENPNISGQTFYGFTQLSLSSNFKDESLLHEKVAHDIFREFGIPSPRTSYYRVYVDYGDGPVYFGLYTMVEVVFDTMLNDQFGTNSGNCYKPDGDGCRMNDISLINSTSFPNKTNELADLSDIEALVSALIDDSRISNPSQWRSNLENVIDMDHYLRYLAANQTMTNWDTYGKMTHNFYMYNNPSNNLLQWIPWDNNEAFAYSPNGNPGGPMGILDFDFGNLSDNPMSSNGQEVAWPLLRYVYDDPVYRAQYETYIDEFISTVFTVSNLTDKFNTNHDLISPYVVGIDGEISGYTHLSSEAAFTGSVADLINFVNDRITDAANYTP